jgi:molecular chaperone DnaJ
VDVEVDARFERDGVDLVTRVHVSFTEAALGAAIRVPALEPEEDKTTLSLTLPPGTQSNALFTMKGHGIPRLDGRGRGSLVVVVQVAVPTSLSPRARELLSELDAELKVDATATKRVAAGNK